MKGGGDENARSRFWDRTWNSVTFANTIISNVGKVEGLDPTLRDEYLDVLTFIAPMPTITVYYCLVIYL